MILCQFPLRQYCYSTTFFWKVLEKIEKVWNCQNQVMNHSTRIENWTLFSETLLYFSQISSGELLFDCVLKKVHILCLRRFTRFWKNIQLFQEKLEKSSKSAQFWKLTLDRKILVFIKSVQKLLCAFIRWCFFYLIFVSQIYTWVLCRHRSLSKIPLLWRHQN